MTLPRFLGIGALKAGTSTLHALLSTHPGLAFPASRKEVMFFDRHWERGLDWYAAHFADAGDRIPGEITPSYLYDPAVPARVASTLPDVRLFAVLRDPVARAVSQWRFHRQETAEALDLATFLSAHPNAVARGRYAEQLERWLDHHPRERLLLLTSDALATDPARVVREVLRHVGADPTFVPPNLGARRNESGTPRHPLLRAAARSTIRWLYDHDLGDVVQAVKRTPLARVIDARTRDDEAPPPDVLRRLQEGYAPDLARLRERFPELLPDAPWLREGT